MKKKTYYNIKSTKKNHSFCSVSSAKKPSFNKSIIPTHIDFHSISLMQAPRKQRNSLEFWGCIDPPPSMQAKKQNKEERRSEEKKEEKRRSSNLILLRYLQRKQKKIVTEPQTTEIIEIINKKKEEKLQERRRGRKAIKTQIQNQNYFQNWRTEPIAEPKEEDQLYSMKKEAEERKIQKIEEITKIIQWKSRVVEGIDRSIRKIKNQEFNI